ncbi:MAG: hypothetical protein V4642_00090 [Bacteroidota bacterium]
MIVKFSFVTLILATFLFSCSDNSNDLDPNCSLEDAMMLKVGNYWIYTTTQIDENGNAVAGTERIDSSFVSAMQNVAGKTAFQMITIKKSLKGIILGQDTISYAIEGSKVSSVTGVPVNDNWIIFADCSKKQWNVADDTFKGGNYNLIDANGNPVVASVEAHIKVTGLNQGLENLIMNNSTISTSLFNLKQYSSYKILSNGSAVFKATNTKELSFEIDNKKWLADGIGIVKEEVSGFKIGNEPTRNGIRKTLIRYSVK